MRRKTRARRRAGGWTMIELMIAVGIIGIVVSSLYQLWLLGYQMWMAGSVQIQLQQDARNAMDEIVTTLREANASTVNISEYVATLPFSAITFTDRRGYTVGYGMVRFNDPFPRSYASYQDKKYALVRRVVPVEQIPGSIELAMVDLMARNVVSMYFTYPGGEDFTTIQCGLTLSKTIYGKRVQTIQVKETVRMMNP